MFRWKSAWLNKVTKKVAFVSFFLDMCIVKDLKSRSHQKEYDSYALNLHM
jgi:hypothetical protein